MAGIFFLAFFLFVSALRADIGQPFPESVRTTIWITTVSALFHGLLLGASSTAALIGRKDYLLWMSRDRRKAAGLSNDNPNAMTGDDFSNTFG